MTDQPAAWLPDGHGLADRARELVAERGDKVHLRLSASGDGPYPRAGCGLGLGEWWTGLAAEVNCPACLELVHA